MYGINLKKETENTRNGYHLTQYKLTRKQLKKSFTTAGQKQRNKEHNKKKLRTVLEETNQ